MPARRSVSSTAPEQASLNLTYPVGYASCTIVIDHTSSWRRGDALHIAAIRRCLRYATCKQGLVIESRGRGVLDTRFRGYDSKSVGRAVEPLQPGKPRLHRIARAVEFAQIRQTAHRQAMRILLAGVEQRGDVIGHL